MDKLGFIRAMNTLLWHYHTSHPPYLEKLLYETVVKHCDTRCSCMEHHDHYDDQAGLYPHEKQPSGYFVPTPSTVTV